MEIYTIKNIVGYRKIDWKLSNDFFYLTEIPSAFEPFVIQPDYYCFGIINEGFMKMEIDNKIYNITTSSFMIYRPDESLKIIEIEPNTKGSFILFTRRFIQNFQPSLDAFFTNTFLHKNFDSHILMKPEDHEHLTIIFKKIFDVLSSIYTDRWEMTARNLIIALINETDSILNKYSNSLLSFSKGERSIINKFKSLAKDNFAQQKPISFYIKKLNVSASQFYKIFKNENEKSPSSYLNNLLLSEAKFLLSNSELNIGEIAFKLAFSDIYAFSKYFKKHTTHSPSAFRQLKLAGNK